MNDVIKTPDHKNPRGQLLLWFVLLLVIGSVLYAGRFFYITQQQLVLHLETIDTHQQITMAKTTKKIDEFKLELSKINTRDAMNTDQQWSLYKAQYAIQLAQLNAKWSDDTATTIALLQQADSFLSKQSQAQLFSVRQALAREISEEQTATILDVPGLLSQLDALQQLVATDTFTKPIHTQTRKPTPTTPAPVPETWRGRLKETLLSFQQFFVIRYHESPLEPLMSPAFQTVQKEIIRLNLQEAEWAVLEKNNTIYQLALKQAYENICRAFDTKNDKVTIILKQLEQLQTIALQTNPAIPNESLPLLETVIKNMTPAQPGAAS